MSDLKVYKPARIRRLEAIYASIPTLECKRLCGRQFCGPVLWSKLEHRNIGEFLGGKFRRPPCEEINELQCSYLNNEDLCDIYPVRPLICRLWGVSELLKCPHGCVPSRWLSDQECKVLMREVEDL